MLLPRCLTPFSYGDRLKPMVKDGCVSSIFSLPSTFDALQLKALTATDLNSLAKAFGSRLELEDLDFEHELSLLVQCTGPALLVLELLHLLAQLFAARYATSMLHADPICLLEAQRQSREPTVDLEQLFAAHTKGSRSEESPTQGEMGGDSTSHGSFLYIYM